MIQQKFYDALIERDIYKHSVDEYEAIHRDILTPTIYRIENFDEEIKKYHQHFVQWGPTHTQFPRYGLSLVNRTGDYLDNASNSPLDTHYEYNNEILWDTDFTLHTPALQMKSLDVIQPLKKYMIRSNILWWNNLGHFKPHVDISKNFFTHIRLWGTNKSPKEYIFKFNGKNLDFEPGRLYIVDTSILHEAKALVDYTYTYFFSIQKQAYDDLDLLL